ncbi:MAG: acyltransferase [Anaerolineae bacterium]|nr:acyltransferase [Anaerolineae bacterium]
MNSVLASDHFPFLRKHLPNWAKRLILWLYWTWYDTRDALVALIGYLPSHTLRLASYRLLFGIKIGSHTSIHRGCRFYNPSGVTIGQHTVINRGVLLDGRRPLTIGDNVSISEEAMLLTLEHDPDSPTFEMRGEPVVIKDRVFLGTRVIVLPGITIGEGAVVAAGAVVSYDVEDYAIVGGVPARMIRYRNRGLNYQLNYRKLFG